MKYEIPDNSIILSIKEDVIVDSLNDWDEEIEYKGLIIETDKGSIKLVIDNRRQCCENSGALFFDTPDDVSRFIGAFILEIETIDIEREGYMDNETQLRIITSKGVIQYAIYNKHNGHYAHATIIQVFDSIKHSSL